MKEVCPRKRGVGLTLNPDNKVGDDEDYEESVRSDKVSCLVFRRLVKYCGRVHDIVIMGGCELRT